ncbi:EamA family transporter [Thalassotalea psychrophila]|uniref:EamA family transporter n=1 Tax=Thalassotalea psychrophila TaxID=3065647 RepID=A0ABY9TUJ6_9GAMM|nr:EamA family transporter [Colwelliaceae bacterium SQ149]
MIYLVVVSIVWAFSFGLIKGQLTGIQPEVVASIRLLLCVVSFLPCLLFLKSFKPNSKLMLLGALQFGVMYLAYIQSYQYLPGYLVAVFTIFTPMYVLLVNAVINKYFNMKHLLPVLISIVGASVIVFKSPQQAEFITGFLLLQLANIAFAIGQVSYKHVAKDQPDSENMLWMYIGAALLASTYTVINVDLSQVNIAAKQWWALIYLGVISSGLCFYFWNKGSKQVNTPTLAVMNNGYVPLAVIFAITFFAESADYMRLSIGGALIGLSVYLAYSMQKKPVKINT